MDDRIERFITENREEFDFRDPDPGVWTAIENRIRPRRKTGWRLILQRAAIVAIIFAASYTVNEMVHRYRNTGLRALNKKEKQETGIPGLKEAEAYYNERVNQKMDELRPIISNCPWLEDELKFDMSELDSVYADLKNDLKDDMANQEVIEAIIDNYRLKISILESLLSDVRSHEGECLTEPGHYAL